MSTRCQAGLVMVCHWPLSHRTDGSAGGWPLMGAGRDGEAFAGTYVGVLECDVLLGAIGSLKHKRAVIRPVLARLRRLDVAVTETGDPDRHRRALIAIATVSSDVAQVHRVLDTCEREVAGEVELELLSTRRRVIGPYDE